MPQIIIENLFNTNINGDPNLSILDNIHENYIDCMHACGKKGNCTTCKMIILEGSENLTPRSRSEEKFAALGKLSANERLACQCKATGDISVKVPDLYKLPHVEYSS